MTKWVALALGALLALVGAVCIGLGYDVIQTERGGVLVIAGAVALTGGVLTFALFAVLGELRALLAVRSMQPMDARTPTQLSEPAQDEMVAPTAIITQEAPALAPTSASVKIPEPPPSQPVFHEPPATGPGVPATADKPATSEPKVWDRPSPFRSSSFGAPRAPTPLAVFAGAATVAAAVNKDEAAEPVSEPPVSEPVAVDVEEQVERAIAQALANESVAASPAESHDVETPQATGGSQESHDAPLLEPPRQPRSLREALGLQALPPEEAQSKGEATPPQAEKPVEEEAKPAPAPLIDVEATPSVAAGYAWLERALATEDGRKSRALEWLRARQRSGGVDDSPRTDFAKTVQETPPAPEPVREPVSEGTPKAEPKTPEVLEPEARAEPEAVADLPSTPDHWHERESEPEQDASEAPKTQMEPEGASSFELEPVFEPEPEPEASADLEEQPQELVSEPEPEQQAAPAPTIVGRYSSGGSDFTLYSDGSIDAQTDQGLFHFASMAELRAHIEAQNAQG